MEEIGEAIDSFFKTKIQKRIIYRKDTAGIRIKINLSELVLVETSGRKLKYLMHDGSEHFCEGRIPETAQSSWRGVYYGYDISDYESESSYRFLADSSNIETVEDDRIYISIPNRYFLKERLFLAIIF